jgi:hypothetical protein
VYQDHGIGLLAAPEGWGIGHHPSLAAAGLSLPELHSQGDAHLRKRSLALILSLHSDPLSQCSSRALLKPVGSHGVAIELLSSYRRVSGDKETGPIKFSNFVWEIQAV